MQAYVTIGLPGSGKSSIAKRMVNENPNLVRVNRDDLRIQILTERGIKLNWHNALKKDVESEVQKRQDRAIIDAARAGKDVVVDNCHLSDFIQKKITSFLNNLGYSVEYIDCRDVPLEVCLERNAKREGFAKINPDVIRNMHRDHIAGERKMITRAENLPNWEPMEETPTCIIVDIDGTLAEKCDRSPYDETRVFDDNVRHHVLATVKALMKSGQVDHCFIFSGRKNGCRQETMRWLEEKCSFTDHSLTFDGATWSLHMRESSDCRRDSLVKTDLFNEFVLNKFNVMAVFDDRGQVIRECWKPLGVPVFNCGVIDEQDF